MVTRGFRRGSRGGVSHDRPGATRHLEANRPRRVVPRGQHPRRPFQQRDHRNAGLHGGGRRQLPERRQTHSGRRQADFAEAHQVRLRHASSRRPFLRQRRVYTPGSHNHRALGRAGRDAAVRTQALAGSRESPSRRGGVGPGCAGATARNVQGQAVRHQGLLAHHRAALLRMGAHARRWLRVATEGESAVHRRCGGERPVQLHRRRQPNELA